jgi:hypothetical protein
MLAEASKSVILYYTSLRTHLKEYTLSCDLRLGQLYDHVNRHRHFTLRLVLMTMPISTNMAIIGLIERTEDVDEAEDKALARTEEVVKGIHTAEEIEHSDRSATFAINRAVGQRSTPPRNVRKHTRSSVSKLRTQQSKMLPPSSTAAFLSSTKDLKELTILLLPPNLIPSSLCQ